MKLNLLDINSFIERNNVKQVTDSRMYIGGGRHSLDPKGLFSEEIFGRLGSNERKKTFGYVDLRTKCIHPEAWVVLTSVNTDLTKLILNKQKYSINKKGLLVPDEENGSSGLIYFIKNIDNIDFRKFADKKAKEVEFVLKYKKFLLIDKYLVLPAGIRDIHLSRSSGKTTIQYSEITQLYERLLKQANSIMDDIELFDEELANSIIERMQHALNSINGWIKDRMKGKQGLIRGGMLKKVTDYSARMNITPDPGLDLGWCGISWQMILKLYEPYSVYQILNKDKAISIPLIQQYLNTKENIDINELKRFLTKINDDPYTVKGPLKDYLFSVAEIIMKDKVIVYKRDPSENRDSWISCYVKVLDTCFVLKTNPFDLNKNGGD